MEGVVGWVVKGERRPCGRHDARYTIAVSERGHSPSQSQQVPHFRDAWRWQARSGVYISQITSSGNSFLIYSRYVSDLGKNYYYECCRFCKRGLTSRVRKTNTRVDAYILILTTYPTEIAVCHRADWMQCRLRIPPSWENVEKGCNSSEAVLVCPKRYVIRSFVGIRLKEVDLYSLERLRSTLITDCDWSVRHWSSTPPRWQWFTD